MRLVRGQFKNFRSLRDNSVDFGSQTALIGGNGAGKSSVLRAIEKFYTAGRAVDVNDWYGRDTNLPIEIELTFCDLTPAEIATFGTRVRDGRLTVTRVFDNSPNSGRYHGVVPSNPEFQTVRLVQGARELVQAYDRIRVEQPEYGDLPMVRSQAAALTAMQEWEQAHPERLELLRDDGQFFGFQNAGRGTLQRHTNFVFIPAVREAASDATETKNSAISQLLELVVRSVLLNRADVAAFRAEVNQRFQALTSPENMPELGRLGATLTTELQRLYSDAAVNLMWKEACELMVPLPAADVSLSQDGFSAPVDRQGHGLQRAFILTLLQQLAQASTNAQLEAMGRNEAVRQEHDQVVVQDQDVETPSLILAIEEPELYQHPTKQRHFASVLRKLSEGRIPGIRGRVQVIFASHSPTFISMPNVSEIRFTRRSGNVGDPLRACEISALNLESVAEKLGIASQAAPGRFSAAALQPRLHILGPELSEGFFADGIVLVEGPSDRAALMAAANQLGVDFEESGIAVVAAGGKNNIDRPYLIYRELGIEVYPVWDCDCRKGEGAAANLRILRSIHPNDDHRIAPTTTQISDDFACFQDDLEAELKNSLTAEIYDRALSEVCEIHEAVRDDAKKNPEIVRQMLARSRELGQEPVVLHDIVRAVWRKLKRENI